MEYPPIWHSTVAVEIDGTWYKTGFIKEVIAELEQKSMMVNAGLTEFSKAERFAIHVLHASRKI